MKEALVSRTLRRIAKRAGVKVHLEPRWRVVGQITFPDGRKSYFRNSQLDLNPLGSSAVASDKGYANYFMERMGYPVVPGTVFFSDKLAAALRSKRNIHAAWRYAKKMGLPVVVKPNSHSQGLGVSKVHDRKEFYRAAKYIFSKDRIMLVQRALTGRDYRIVVLDGEVISAYERIPLTVTGTGRATIRQLLRSLQRSFVLSGRDTVIDPDDFRIKARLRRAGLRSSSVLEKGKSMVLLDNANLSAGGMALDVTGSIHPGFKKIAIRLTRDMGLRYAGVDLMVEGDIDRQPKHYWVLEINDSPGLDHYAASGPEQARRVEAMYLKVLKAMKKKR